MRSLIASLVATTALAIDFVDYDSLLSLSQAGSKTVNGFSPINIEVDGKVNTYYVAADFTTSDPSAYMCPANGRGYVNKTPQIDYS